MTIVGGTNEDNVAGLFELLHLRRVAARAFEPLGFTLYKAELLVLVSRGVEHPQALIRALGVQKPALSALVTKLVRADLMTRSADKRDTRRIRVQLTPQGHEVAERVRGAWAYQDALFDEDFDRILGLSK